MLSELESVEGMMYPTRLAIYDFDGTLFRSPSRPEGWVGGWWTNTESLNRPYVPEVPSVDWWNESVVARALADIRKETTLTAVITGRDKEKFSVRVNQLLDQAGLKFDHVFLDPGGFGSTSDYKLQVVKQLMLDHSSVRNVDIWEDSEENIRVISNHVESKGRAAFPHLVSVVPHAPEIEYMASRVASRFRGRV